jgi:hypothetical protein
MQVCLATCVFYLLICMVVRNCSNHHKYGIDSHNSDLFVFNICYAFVCKSFG